MNTLKRIAAHAALIVCASVYTVSAQLGGEQEISPSTIDGGGTGRSSGGPFELRGTIGQFDADAMSGGTIDLAGGLWTDSLAPATQTPTASITSQPTPTPSANQSASPTATGGATKTATRTDVARTGTATRTSNRTATPTLEASPCVGDCDGDRAVIVAEIVVGINIALGNTDIAACPAFGSGDAGEVTIDRLLQAVQNALAGCREA